MVGQRFPMRAVDERRDAPRGLGRSSMVLAVRTYIRVSPSRGMLGRRGLSGAGVPCLRSHFLVLSFCTSSLPAYYGRRSSSTYLPESAHVAIDVSRNALICSTRQSDQNGGGEALLEAITKMRRGFPYEASA